MNVPLDQRQSPTASRRGALVGFVLGAVSLALAAIGLDRDLATRPALEVRRLPLVLHGGAPRELGADGPLAWRQALAPLDRAVDTAHIRVADLAGRPPRFAAGGAETPPTVRARSSGSDAWSAATDVHFARESGAEGQLVARFTPPLPQGVPLELEVAADHGAVGATGTVVPFLRYRGPVRPWTPNADRAHRGQVFERTLIGRPEPGKPYDPGAGPGLHDGLGPVTGVALEVGDADLGTGPVKVWLRGRDDATWRTSGELLLGARAQSGNVLVPLATPASFQRLEAVTVRVELPSEGALHGDAGGVRLVGLYGEPGPRPWFGGLSLSGGAEVRDTDLALTLLGAEPAAQTGPLWARAGWMRLLAAAALWLALATLVGAAVGGAASVAPRRGAAPIPTQAALAAATAAAGIGLRPRAEGPRRATFALCALAVLLVALFLRLSALDSGALSGDDGEILHSARIHQLTPSRDLGAALREDRAWFRELAEDLGRHPERTTYQHGYLHQLAVRWAWRLGGTFGVGRVTALRIDQALLGALTALLIVLWVRRRLPAEPWVALAAGAFVATQVAHVALSRTGWSQVGCTFFLLAAMALALRMRDMPEDRHLPLLRVALAIALCTVLAYGFHEMATVYTAALGLIVLLEFHRDSLGRARWPWRSRRVWYGALACVPVGLMTVGLLLYSEYARVTWFDQGLSGLTWWGAREAALAYFAGAELPAQLGWFVLALAPIGFVGAVLRDMAWARWLALWCVIPTAVLFLRFNYPHLVRIYLPAAVLLAVFAAEGLGVLYALVRGAVARRGVVALGLAAVTFAGLASWQTMHAPASAPLHVAGVHMVGRELAEPRRPLTPLFEALGAPADANRGGAVGVRTDRLDPLFRLLDAGYSAELFDPRWELERWPKRVIGVLQLMRKEQRDAAQGGPYQLLAEDRRGVLGLYELTEGR